MGELFDFASVMAKLVIILSVMLMAVSLAFVPERAVGIASGMLMLVVPLFVLTTLLDLTDMIRRR